MRMMSQGSKIKQWLIDYLGLEPGNPKWWGLQKFLTKKGKFDFKKFAGQQFGWHPFESFIPLAGFACYPRWWTAALATFWIRVVHEMIQFKTMPKPKMIEKAICAEDKQALLRGTYPSTLKLRVNGRHLNLAERAADIFVGGAVGWALLWKVYVLVV